MSSTPISAFLITLNEAATLAQVLAPLSALDEIVVVDSGSSDGTVAIAEAAGAKVIHQPWLGFAQQKAFALAQCRNEWCFNVDGDEVVPTALIQQLQDIADHDRADAVRVYFDDLFMGQRLHAKSHKRSIIRCFKQSVVSYPIDKKVHENVTINGRVMNQKHPLISHYGYQTVHDYMAKQNQYSSLAALEKHERSKSASLLKLLLVFPLIFIKELLPRKMICSGIPGLIHAFISASYAFMKEAKLYEQQCLHRQKGQQTLDKEQITNKH